MSAQHPSCACPLLPHSFAPRVYDLCMTLPPLPLLLLPSLLLSYSVGDFMYVNPTVFDGSGDTSSSESEGGSASEGSAASKEEGQESEDDADSSGKVGACVLCVYGGGGRGGVFRAECCCGYAMGE